MCYIPLVSHCYRVTLTSDDDLSLESDSDNMEIEQEVKGVLVE